MFRNSAAFILVLFFSLSSSGFACDLCALYNSIESQKLKGGQYSLGVAEQFSEFGRLQTDGERMPNDMHQRLSSSITQILAGYDVTDRFSLQLSLPYINRRYNRAVGSSMEKGTETGFGDATILGRYQAFQHHESDTFIGVQLLGGIKLPTGSSDKLKEDHTDSGSSTDTMTPSDGTSEGEMSDSHTDHHGSTDEMASDHAMTSLRHGDEMGMDHVAAVHGHDLALGTGSVDFPLGLSLFVEKGRMFIKGSFVRTFRTKGDHDYQMGDDTNWNFGPAYYLSMSDEFRLAARVAVSGEQKSKDTSASGDVHDDTGMRALYWGPELIYGFGGSLTGDLGLDIPARIDNSGTQVVPSYRLRGGLTYHF